MATSNTGVGLILDNKNLSPNLVESKDVPLLATQFDIFIGKGTETKLFALDTIEAGVYAELGSATADDTTFASIDFDQKRVATAIEMTEQAINAQGIGLQAYLKDILTKRLFRKFAGQALGYGTADGANEFQSILDYNTGTKKINSTDIKTFTGGVTLANINLAFEEFDETNSSEAICIVDSLATLRGLLDEAGQLVLKKENRANGSKGTVFGRHVFVQPMNGKAKMVLMNPKAYAVSVSENSGITVGISPTSAEQMFVGNAFAQGKVVDPNAIKIIKA